MIKSPFKAQHYHGFFVIRLSLDLVCVDLEKDSICKAIGGLTFL